MKRFLKYTALVLILAVMAVTLCSCQRLDDMRAHQLFYTNEKKTEIEYNDHIYRQIDPGKRSFVFNDLFELGMTFHATAKDVPVLLASSQGDWVEINREQTIMSNFSVGEDEVWYVRDDYYDTAKAAVESKSLDHYYFNYSVYDEDGDDALFYEGYRSVNVLLDDQQAAAVEKALAQPEDKRVSYRELNSYIDTLSLFACDADMIVQDEDISVFLIKDGSDYYVWNGNTYSDKSICKVDEADRDMFKQLFKDYPDAVEPDDISWRFDSYDEYDISDGFVDDEPEAVAL